MMREYDVVIIGAGPAGSMLLRFLQNKNLKIAIVDSRKLSEPYSGKGLIKSCGGMLSPDAQEFLKQNKIRVPQDVLDMTQPKFVRTFDKKSGLVRNYKRNYINIDREKFDRYLLEGLRSDRHFGYVVRNIKVVDEHYVINDEIKTKILVGADGASSKVRKTFFPDLRVRKYVAVQDVVVPRTSSKYKCYFDESISDYYGWSLPKGETNIVGFALPDSDHVLASFEKFKKDYDYPKPIARQGTLLLRPNFFHKVSAKENLFLIGEAGGYISPSSAEGISYAFKTAKILAESEFDLKKFRSKMKTIQLNIFYKNLKSILMYTPFIRRILMRLSFTKE